MKKLLTAMAVAALTAATLACSAIIGVSATEFDINHSPADTGEMLGDGNGDGAINARDILAIKRDVVGIEKAYVGADANSDGKINARDILAIKRHIVGIEKLTDIPTPSVGIFAVEGVNIRDMTIVAPAGSNPDEDNSAYAATELQKYIFNATSVRVPIVYTGVSPTEHAFYIITDPTWGGWDSDDWDGGELRREDFVIETRDGNVYITGGYLRGCMYGVYEFVEEYLGWRFMNNNEFLYKADIVNLKNGIYDKQEAVLSYRTAGNGGGDKRKMNASHNQNKSDKKYGYTCANNLINAHSFAYYRYIVNRDGMEQSLDWVVENYDKYEGYTFGDDPVIDSWNSNWQPCFTREYDEMFYGLVKMSAIVWKAWDRVIIPGESRMSFSLMDNENYCQCSECREKYARIGVSGAGIEFASRAADEYQEYFPGVKLYTILYEHSPYTDGLYVSEHLAIMYCGTGCNNHVPGSGQCGDGKNSLPLKVTGEEPNRNNNLDEVSFPSWCNACDNMYFWEYAVTYLRNLAPCPNVLNIYGDMKFIIDNGGEGIYYESGSGNYFEALKVYIGTKVMWDTEMNEDELKDIILEYLYFNYGEGYHELYRIIELMDEAGNGVDCFINNHDYPMEMYSLEVLDTQYEEILELVPKARQGCMNDTQRTRFDRMSMNPYFMALSGAYDRVYVNGTEDQRSEYESVYNYVYYYLMNNNIPISSGNSWLLPTEFTLDKNPMFQFYGTGYSGQR